MIGSEVMEVEVFRGGRTERERDLVRKEVLLSFPYPYLYFGNWESGVRVHQHLRLPPSQLFFTSREETGAGAEE